MAEHIKLEIGQDITLTVDKVSELTTGKWPEYAWAGYSGGRAVIVTTPKAAADRQLQNVLNATLTSVVGETITIERAPNKEDAKKSWWNMSYASPAATKPQPAGKRLPSPPVKSAGQAILDAAVPPDSDPAEMDSLIAAHEGTVPQSAQDAPQSPKMEALITSYLALWERVAEAQVAAGKRLGFPVDGTSINSATATLVIQASQRGIA